MFRNAVVAAFLLIVSCSGTEVTYDSVAMDSTVSADSAAETYITPYRDSLTERMATVLATSPTPITRGRPDSPLGSLIADVILHEATLLADSMGIVPELCILNIGGLRIDLPEGDITVNHIFELMPFENGISLVQLTPEGMADMIAHIAEVGGQPVSGIRLKKEADSSVSCTVNGKPLEDRNYWAVTSDYLADGGDRMAFFAKHSQRVETGLRIRDAIIRNFARAGQAGRPIVAPTDRRITIAP